MGVFRHQDCATGQPTGSVWLDGSCSSGKLQKGASISLGAVLGIELFFMSVKINYSYHQGQKCNKRLSKEPYRGGLVRLQLYLATGYLVVSFPKAVR